MVIAVDKAVGLKEETVLTLLQTKFESLLQSEIYTERKNLENVNNLLLKLFLINEENGNTKYIDKQLELNKEWKLKIYNSIFFKILVKVSISSHR